MNKISRLLLCAELFSACLLVAGCDDDGTGDDAGGDSEAPLVTLDSVTPLAEQLAVFEVSATASDDVGVVLVELLVDDEVAASSDVAPYAFSWDASGAPYGEFDLVVRATDAAGNAGESEPVPMEHVELDEGAEGTMVIPDDYDGTQETDVKHHWTTGAEVPESYVAWAGWEPADDADAWVITLEVGSGFCPHTGQTLDAAAPDQESPAQLESAPEDGFPTESQLFVHVRANASAHVGESLPLTFHVFAL